VYACTVKSDLMAKPVRTVAATPVFQSSLIFACCAVLTSAYDKSNAHYVTRIVLSLPQHAVTAAMAAAAGKRQLAFRCEAGFVIAVLLRREGKLPLCQRRLLVQHSPGRILHLQGQCFDVTTM